MGHRPNGGLHNGIERQWGTRTVSISFYVIIWNCRNHWSRKKCTHRFTCALALFRVKMENNDNRRCTSRCTRKSFNAICSVRFGSVHAQQTSPTEIYRNNNTLLMIRSTYPMETVVWILRCGVIEKLRGYFLVNCLLLLCTFAIISGHDIFHSVFRMCLNSQQTR